MKIVCVFFLGFVLIFHSKIEINQHSKTKTTKKEKEEVNIRILQFDRANNQVI